MSSDTVRVRRKVWTKKNTDPLFIPLHQGSAVRVTRLKVDYNLQEATTNLRVRRTIQYSNDGGKTWTGTTEFGAAYSGSTGWSNDTAYTALDDDYRLFQVGLRCKNDTGPALELGRVDAIIALSYAQR
ncbi:MAG: exo-alpha-sialidase [Deltaproteobacteria bacterium]|nr:exo-alpha-sialidase [Deltaproteobacteria bacterium]